jgi:CRP-like cAMP-binding protein
MYERLPNGDRQIYAFQYPGDFCDLNRHVLPGGNHDVAVAAISDCRIGIIDHSELDRLVSDYPSLGLALWRSTMLEAAMLRKRLLSVGRQPALQRIAHLLCEQLARQGAVGIDSAIVPFRQIDLADAAGLSIVHVNRTFNELQRRGLLVKEGRRMRVVDRTRLALLAAFDGAYLNMPHLLSDWTLEIERPRLRVERRSS